MISLHGMSKKYGERTVIDSLSLELGDVGVTSLIGANGAGKSTLFALIGRLLTPDAGTISVDGMPTATSPPARLARTIALLRQDNHLTARLRVQDLVQFGRYPHTKGRLGPEDKIAVERAIEYLGLAPFRTRFLDELSGGQRQRAFIAMVLAQDTKYVLLDEPLNSLDLRHAVQIMRLLRQMADELGKRIVVVLHDINFAAAHSDRMIALRDGRIVADLPPAELMSPALLQDIYDLPVQVHTLDQHPVAVYYR